MIHPADSAPPPGGLWAPALTPLDDGDGIDGARLAAHVQRLLDQGCDGVVLFGTTGEAPSWSVTQRQAALQHVRAAGVAPPQLMIGCGCAALADSVALARHALQLGCRQLLVVPPFYFKGVADDGVFAWYAALIAALGDASVRLWLYHFPRLSGVALSPALVARLREAFGPVIAGVKDSSGDAAQLRALCALEGLAVFAGSERLLRANLRCGGAGCITATANVQAPGLRTLLDGLRIDRDGATTAEQQVLAVRTLFERYPLAPALKAALALQLGDPAWARPLPPLLPLDAGQQAQLAQQLGALDLRTPASTA